MGKYHWFKLFRIFNGIINNISIIAFIAWWWFPWAIYVAIGGFAWFVMVFLAVWIPGMMSEKHLLPRWMERLAFEAYVYQIKIKAKNISPLVAYPFAIFCDLTLPNIFREKGLAAVLQEIREWPDKFRKRTEKSLAQHTELLQKQKPSYRASPSLQKAVDRAVESIPPKDGTVKNEDENI